MGFAKPIVKPNAAGLKNPSLEGAAGKISKGETLDAVLGALEGQVDR